MTVCWKGLKRGVPGGNLIFVVGKASDLVHGRDILQRVAIPFNANL